MPESSIELAVQTRWSQDGVAEGYLLVAPTANRFIRTLQTFHGLEGNTGDEATLPIITDEYGMSGVLGYIDQYYIQHWSGLITAGAPKNAGRDVPTHLEIIKNSLVAEENGFIAALIDRGKASKAEKALRKMSGRFGRVVLEGKVLTVAATDELPSVADSLNEILNR